MPFQKYKEGSGWCVYSLNADGSKNNNHGCHSDEASANAQLQALYASGADKKEFDMSGWGLTPDKAQQVGTFLTLFNGKVHQAVTSVTDELSMRGHLSEEQIKVLTDIKGAMLKVFNEQCPDEIAGLKIDPETLDAIADKELGEQMSQLLTVKEVNSPYDWIMFTSSAFQDREGQIVSKEAHAQDIAWMEQNNSLGTIDWWHLHPIDFEYLQSKEAVAKLPPLVQANGVILGDCTFSAMYNKIRIEAGTYRSKEIKSAMDANKDNLSASLLFFHPKFEPIDGVYHTVRTVSRAIMPKDKVSNYAPYLQGAM